MPELNKETKLSLPLTIPIIAIEKNSKPAIELRKAITDKDLIKQLISAAYYEVPIIILPMFTNKITSLASLVEKGILYQEEGKFFFTF